MKVTIEAEDHELEQLQELVEVWIKDRVEKIIEEKKAEEQAKANWWLRHAAAKVSKAKGGRSSGFC